MQVIEKTIVREVKKEGLLQVITLTLKISTAEEAIRLYSLGYLTEATLLIAGVPVPSLSEKGIVAYNVITKCAIQKAVFEYFGYDAEKLALKSRKRKYVFPRQISMYLLRKHTSYNLTDIAGIYNRDHSIVNHSQDTIKGFLNNKGESSEKEIINDFLSKYSFE